MIIRVKDLKPEDLAILIEQGWLSDSDIADPENILAQFNL
tara:strand:- start:68 stop:187 length:120 start_codon:yes stop_codon:yes gene_type:complete